MKYSQMNGKLQKLLVTAILVLCAGFLIMSCGDPQQKTKDTDKGAYAIDFSQCPGADYCHLYAQGNDAKPAPDLSGGLTVETWVKRKGTTGGVFSRLDAARGGALYIKNDEPKFAIRVQTGVSTTPGVTSSVDYIVSSGVTLVQDAWTHIAGVVADAVHSHFPTSTSCTQTVMAENPHLDVYVDGVFKNCATTWGASGDPATGPQFADNPEHNQLEIGTLSRTVDSVNGGITPSIVIDEVRIWTVARTEAEINACMNKELGIGGTCDRGDINLGAYYRFNEGHENGVTDFSGSGMSGSLYSWPGEHEWENGWVAGNPNLQRAN